jgi:hypothetical protein
VVIAILLCPHLVYAQKTLGDVLDAGGSLMSVEQFKQEIMQRLVTGPTRNEYVTHEIMYGSKGSIDGIAFTRSVIQAPSITTQLTGQWYAGEKDSVCATMLVRSGGGSTVTLPRRCQYWFKVGDQYFLSDSDIDRQAQVFARTIKP